MVDRETFSMNPFGGPGAGSFNIEGMLRQAEQAQQRAAQARERRAEMKAVGASEDGLVEATVDGNGRVVGLHINSRAMRMDSVTLTETVLAAIGHAYEDYQEQADQVAGEALGDPELYAKIKSGNFDMYQYLRDQGVNVPELRGLV